MATTGGRDEMRTPVEQNVPLGRCAVETFERAERMRPAVLGVLMLSALSIMVPGVTGAIGFALGGIALLIDLRFRRAAYRFVGTPDGQRRDTAEFWSLTSMAYVLFTVPVLLLMLAYQVVTSMSGAATL
jgi:hypothetical protein